MPECGSQSFFSPVSTQFCCVFVCFVICCSFFSHNLIFCLSLDCRVLIQDDASISRKHSVITVQHDEANLVCWKYCRLQKMSHLHQGQRTAFIRELKLRHF